MVRRCLGCAAAFTAVATPGHNIAADRPNVIIMADDLGYGDLSCYGSRQPATPYIDALAADGIRCADFYVTSPISTPTRVKPATAGHQWVGNETASAPA